MEENYQNSKRYLFMSLPDDAARLAKTVEALVGLRDRTHPDLGEESAVLKDSDATLALSMAGQLIQDLVGWAIDHHAGLAHADLEFVPLGSRRLPAYKEAANAVDSHEHEAFGANLRRGSAKLSPEGRRKFLSSIFFLSGMGIPDGIAQEFSYALQALDHGEVQSVLRPKRTGKKVNFTEQQEQLKAIGFAKFRHSSGLMRSGEAQEEVAKVFNVSAETLRSWEKRLRDQIGAMKVSQELHFATNAASYVKEMKSTNRSRALSMLIEDDLFGDEALRLSAARFNASRRDVDYELDQGDM